MNPSPPSVPFALLPAGLRDRLPAQAEAAARLNQCFLSMVQSHGYRLVVPPLAEFQTTLSSHRNASGAGSANGASEAIGDHNLLRFIDPTSGRTLAFRPDMTRQVGRIATSLLATAPRPLRLCYSGQVVRLAIGRIRSDREILQMGAELIGRDSLAAAQEIVTLAIATLEAMGLENITIDFTIPNAVTRLAQAALPLDTARQSKVRAALDAKDAGALQQLDAAGYLPLLQATGDFAEAMRVLRAFDKSGALTPALDALQVIASEVEGRARLTLDATEQHGFVYQSWFGFLLFVEGHSEAIGRGGAYQIASAAHASTDSADSAGEVAVGFSLYPDPLIDVEHSDSSAEAEARATRLFLPLDHDSARAEQLRDEGWTTLAALDAKDDGAALDCGYWLDSTGQPQSYTAIDTEPTDTDKNQMTRG